MSRVRTDLGDAYIVSDGMGGHKAGALAAEITVEVLQRKIAAIPKHGDLKQEIKQAFAAANAEVHRKAHSGDAQTEGMGATAVVLLALRSSVVVAHVGDSRAYLLRDGKLRPLTNDHTRVQRMLAAGMLTEQQAKDHPDAGLLERVIGHHADVEVDVSEPIELDYGDELLLCSDGLCSYVEHAQIEATLAKPVTPSEQVDELVALSLANGGQDNVTVQVIRYEGGMNERRRQIVAYQIAFLPVVALVAGATAYGVDYLSHRPPSAAGSRDATAAASTAPTLPRADPELQSSVATLKSNLDKVANEVGDLSTRVARLETPGSGSLPRDAAHVTGTVGATNGKPAKGGPEAKPAMPPVPKPADTKGAPNSRGAPPAPKGAPAAAQGALPPTQSPPATALNASPGTQDTSAAAPNAPTSGQNANPSSAPALAGSATPPDAKQDAMKSDTTVNASPPAPAQAQ